MKQHQRRPRPRHVIRNKRRILAATRWIAVFLLGIVGASLAAAAERPAADDSADSAAAPAASPWMPTRWPLGTRARYAVQWEREFPPGIALDAALLSGLNGRQTATVDLEVMADRSDQQYLLWRPHLPAAQVDLQADIALAIWRLAISQTLEVVLTAHEDGSLAYTLRNQESLRRSLWPKLLEIARHAGVEPDCEGESQTSIFCRLNSAEGLSDWLLRPIAGYFECVGLEAGADAEVEWTAPHPSPTIGAAVQMHHRHQWLPAQADGWVRTQTTTVPDAAQLQSWARTQLAPGHGEHPAVVQALALLHTHTTVHCVIDPESGLPVEVHRTQLSGEDPALQARESVRFQRLGTL